MSTVTPTLEHPAFVSTKSGASVILTPSGKGATSMSVNIDYAHIHIFMTKAETLQLAEALVTLAKGGN